MTTATAGGGAALRIAILGAGAMGSLFGGLLAAAGEDVTLIDIDDAHLDAIRAHGLRLDTDAGERRIDVGVARPEAATGTPDLLIVFTKTLHTRAALEGVRHLIGPGTWLLSLQNGLGNAGVLAAYVPADRVLVGVTTIPADLAGPGHVRSHGAGGIALMTADGSAPAMPERVARALAAAGLPARVDPGVTGAIWEKAAFNAALNSVCAVAGCAVGRVAALPEARALAQAIAAEVVAVARATGIAADPDRVAATVDMALDTHGAHKPSMLQDIEAGRRTEIDAINGAVVRAAQAAGVPVPHTAALLALVRLRESRAATAAA